MQSDSIGKLAEAIAKAQSEMKPVKKDSKNPFYNSKYADLSSVWEALKPFHHNGVCITQAPYKTEKDGYIGISTQLTHVSGEWIRGDIEMPMMKTDPQGMGSAITYARRYALGCMTGVVTEDDDDGNGASVSPSSATVSRSANQKKLERLKQAQPVKRVTTKGASGMAEQSVDDQQWELFLEYMNDDEERTNVGKQLKSILLIDKVSDLSGDARRSFMLEYQKACHEVSVPCSAWVTQ